MKFLVWAKPLPGAPAFEDPLTAFRAAQKYLESNLKSGKLDCAFQTMGGGGIAIANADSAEELWQDLLSYPLSSRLTYHVEPVADAIKALEIAVKGLPG